MTFSDKVMKEHDPYSSIFSVQIRVGLPKQVDDVHKQTEVDPDSSSSAYSSGPTTASQGLS